MEPLCFRGREKSHLKPGWSPFPSHVANRFLTSVTVRLGGPALGYRRKEYLCLSLAPLTSGQQLALCAQVCRSERRPILESPLLRPLPHPSPVFGIPDTALDRDKTMSCPPSPVHPLRIRFQALAVPSPAPALEGLRTQCCPSVLSFTGMLLHALMPSLRSALVRLILPGGAASLSAGCVRATAVKGFTAGEDAGLVRLVLRC